MITKVRVYRNGAYYDRQHMHTLFLLFGVLPIWRRRASEAHAVSRYEMISAIEDLAADPVDLEQHEEDEVENARLQWAKLLKSAGR